jgi:hypothetical protein
MKHPTMGEKQIIRESCYYAIKEMNLFGEREEGRGIFKVYTTKFV